LLLSGTNLNVTGTGTLTTNNILVAGGTNNINVPVTFSTPATIIASAGAVATFNGIISGAALAVEGAGTTLLNANESAYSSNITLNSGTLSVGNPTGLGTGTLTLINGTLQASVATTVNNAVVINETAAPASAT